MIKLLSSLDKGGNVVDLTTATADYPLAIGETATLAYTSATSVPLRVATEEGEYRLTLMGDSTVSPTSNNFVYLSANNSNQPIVGTATQLGITTIASNNFATSTTAIQMGASVMRLADFKFFTHTESKSFLGDSVYQYYGQGYNYKDTYAGIWNDTTTAWTSLGTITFPQAQSGKIVIRRIA